MVFKHMGSGEQEVWYIGDVRKKLKIILFLISFPLLILSHTSK